MTVFYHEFTPYEVTSKETKPGKFNVVIRNTRKDSHRRRAGILAGSAEEAEGKAWEEFKADKRRLKGIENGLRKG